MYHNDEIQVRKLEKVILSNSLHGFYIVLFFIRILLFWLRRNILIFVPILDWEY